MDPSLSDRNPIEELAEEFVERYRRGERPSLKEYTDRYPEWADKIRALFPALLVMEKARPEPEARVEGESSPGGGNSRPERVGDYRILREVGRGGMGVVYEAEQESLGRHVALKVLAAHSLLDSRRVQRFRREARAAARLHHTNIVPVHGMGEDGGLHYYVMQFIQGQGLDQVLDELRRLRHSADACGAVSAASVARSLLDGSFAEAGSPANLSPVSEGKGSGSTASAQLPGQAEGSALSHSGWQYWRSVARVGVQVAQALAYASSQGTLHRDIKPSNLLLDPHGTVWVTDFGLAKTTGDEGDLTHTGDIVGTLRYMAPERFQGRADIRSDLYALGLTLYELITLRPAFAEGDRDKLIAQVLHDDPPRPRKLIPTLPRDLETIVLKATARDPAHRYQTPTQLAEDLQRFLDDRPIRARRQGPVQRGWRWCRRYPAVAALAAAVLTTLVAVSWQWWRAERNFSDAEAQRRRAEENFQEARAAVDDCFAAVTEHPTFQEPGMEEARRVLLRSALKYYRDFLDQRGDDPAVQADLAQAYARIGFITDRIDSKTDAIAAYEQARNLYAGLVQANPGDMALRRALGRTHQALRGLYHWTGRLSEAEVAAGEAIALGWQLVGEHATAEDRHDLANGYRGLAAVYGSGARMKEAETEYDTSLDLAWQLADEHPEVPKYQQALAKTYGELGRVYFETGRLPDAEAAWQKARGRFEELVRGYPQVADYQNDLATTHNNLGSYYLNTGRLVEQARDAYLRALPLREQLVRDHPRVIQFRVELAKLHNNLALVYQLTNRADQAEAAFRQALDVRQRLADEHADVPSYRKDLSKTLQDLGVFYHGQGKQHEAEVCFRKALVAWPE